MIFATGATSQSVDVQIVDDTGLPVTGLVAATFPTVKYSRAGANADATLTLADLATITTAWALGGVKERGEGVYRLDLPDAVFSSAGIVTLRAEATNKRLVCPRLEVGAVLDAVVDGSGTTLRKAIRGFLAALLGKTTGNPSSPKFRDRADSKNVIDATVDADGNRTAVTLDLD